MYSVIGRPIIYGEEYWVYLSFYSTILLSRRFLLQYNVRAFSKSEIPHSLFSRAKFKKLESALTSAMQHLSKQTIENNYRTKDNSYCFNASNSVLRTLTSEPDYR